MVTDETSVRRMDSDGGTSEAGSGAGLDRESGLGGRLGQQLWLASRSPRRRLLLEEHGYEYGLAESGLDDGELHPGASDPAAWVMALAYLKATAATLALEPSGRDRPVLGADTVCVVDGQVIGQPTDAVDATRILTLVSCGTHEVLTGVALVCPMTGKRDVFFERTVVRVGDLTPFIEAYVASEAWRGKAGAYNLAERLEAGWPIEYDGDPTSIMGLPMGQLEGRLAAFCDRAE